MNTNHLSAWEQEEYILDERTPQMLRHLTECAECRAAVARLEHGLGVYRKAAVQWSAESLATRPQQFITARRQPILSLRWAMAAVIPIVLRADRAASVPCVEPTASPTGSANQHGTIRNTRARCASGPGR